MNEHKREGENTLKKTPHKKTVGFIIFAVVALVLVLIFATGNNTEEEIPLETEHEEVAGEVMSQRMRSFTEGEFTYSFRDIEWVIEAEDEAGVGVPLTRLAWTLDQFSRRASGVLVTLFNPFDLGLVRGVCEQSTSLVFNYDERMGRPLSFASCVVPGEDTVIDYAAFQQEDAFVVIKRREYQGDPLEAELTQITSIDLREIVQ